MSKSKLTREEAEAVFMLRGASEEAFNKIMFYFERRYQLARDQCVELPSEKVPVFQGTAKAFKAMKDLAEDAEDVLENIKNG